MTEALQIVGLSDIGRVSNNNEDHIEFDLERGLVVLADGMGGHNAGEVASAMACQSIVATMPSALGEDFGLASLQQAIEVANQVVFDHAQQVEECAGMGCTLVACQFAGNMLTVGHMGDARLYRLRDDSLQLLTRDHSVLQEYIDAGLLTKAEARHSTQKNLVTRALGVAREEKAEMQQFQLQAGDIYLLCSDGLNDMVEDDDIEMNLSLLQNNLQLCAQHLIDAANDAGGRDNVSVVLVRVL